MDEMKKYIIEFSEDPYTIRLLKIKNGDECPTTEFKAVTPYTEPDIEKIRKEAYEDGYNRGKHDAKKAFEVYAGNAYQRGMEDAWEAARKIAKLDTDEQKRLFGCFGIYFVAHEYSASEAVEKIKAYEQEQEQKQEIYIGDEIITTSGLYAICSNIDNIKEGWVYLFFDDGSCGAHKIGEIKKENW